VEHPIVLVGGEVFMAEVNYHPGPDRADTVSALGLRWAALGGMLGSPLIEAEEHQPLRSELFHELGTIERGLASVGARSAIEIAAKIDILKGSAAAGRRRGVDQRAAGQREK
jgi:hypothetical protein